MKERMLNVAAKSAAKVLMQIGEALAAGELDKKAEKKFSRRLNRRLAFMGVN